MKRSLILFGTVALLLAARLSAAENATNIAPVSVAALVTESLARNPELRFYEAEIAAAKASVKSAGTWANPEVSATLGHNSASGAGDSVAWSVALMQPFEWPGRIPLRKAIANRDVELAELGLQKFKVTLAARIRTLGYSLYSAQEKLEVAREAARRYADLSDVLVQRDPAGLTAQLEVRTIEAAALGLQREVGKLELELQAALLELNQLRGVPAAAPLRVITPLPVLQPAPALSGLLTVAMTNRFELKLLEAELQQRGERLQLAEHERKSGFSVGPMISEERSGGVDRIVGIGFSAPLPLWNKNKGNIEAAKARQSQAETALLVQRRETERQVAMAWGIYQAKLNELAKWRSDSPEKFKESAALADRHYRLGAVPMTTYVELQKQYLEAVNGLLDTRREALEAALQLEVLTGTTLVNIPSDKEVKP